MPRTSSSTGAAAAAVPVDSGDHRSVKPRKSQQQSTPPEKLPDLDRLIHERVRLGIVSALAANDHLSFNDLKRLLDTTDGNLSVHARKLEDAGYVECLKSYEGRVPRTDYRLTASGRDALAGYLNHLESLIRVARSGGIRS